MRMHAVLTAATLAAGFFAALPAAVTPASTATKPASAASAASPSAGSATGATYRRSDGLEAMFAVVVERAAREPGFWAPWDMDRDGRVSQVEILVCIARRPLWLAERFPAEWPTWWRGLDANRDEVVSAEELDALSARSETGNHRIQVAQAPRKSPYAQDIAAAAAAQRAQAAPGITVGSGGKIFASAAYITQYAYIADYDIVGGNYDPVIGILNTGNVLNVGEVIMTLVPVLTGR